MKKLTGTLIAGLGIGVVALALSPWGAQAETWVPIKGNVRLANGTPVCAMVLANGQYMFSCDGTGAFNLNVPLDGQGQITLFAFADGFAPYRITAAPAGLPALVRSVTAAPGSPLISTTRELACAANNWVRITGEVESFGGAPLCAMVLANGQHMFSCGASQGRYDLTVPADENGHITLFAFADGFQPYSETFIAPECSPARDRGIIVTVDGVVLESRLQDQNLAGEIYCALSVTARNTTASKKQCYVGAEAYDTAGRFWGWSIVGLKLPPGVTDSGWLTFASDDLLVGLSGPCQEVGSWELRSGYTWCRDNW